MTVVVKDVAEEERAIYARLQELAEQGAGRLTPDSLYAEVGVALRACADHVVWDRVPDQGFQPGPFIGIIFEPFGVLEGFCRLFLVVFVIRKHGLIRVNSC